MTSLATFRLNQLCLNSSTSSTILGIVFEIVKNNPYNDGNVVYDNPFPNSVGNTNIVVITHPIGLHKDILSTQIGDVTTSGFKFATNISVRNNNNEAISTYRLPLDFMYVAIACSNLYKYTVP